MFSSKTMLCTLLALFAAAPINAWSFKETEAERIVRVEAEMQAHLAEVQHYQATGQIKSNFRLESSHSALKEARKALAWFVVAYPLLAVALDNYIKGRSSYCSYIPHSVIALVIVWGTENILRGQIELNEKQYAQLSALNK